MEKKYSITPSELTNSIEETVKEDKMQNIIEKDMKTFKKDSTSFPIEVFPKELQNVILAYHQHEDFNIDFLASSMFTVTAAAIGNLWEAKFSSSLIVSPIIFIVLIGPPSCGKTPPLKLAKMPFQEHDRLTDIEYKKQKDEYDEKMSVSKKEREANGDHETSNAPIHKELLVINTTIEQLFAIMHNNPHGIMMFINELDSLISNMSRYSNGNDEAYWIELYDGNQIKYERKTSNEYINLIRPYVSLIGSTQPALLPKMFGGHRSSSGFTTRFLKVYPENLDMQLWKDMDMPEEFNNCWMRFIYRIINEERELDDNGEMIPITLKFSTGATDILMKWQEKIKSFWTDADCYIQGVCGKLKTYVLRFSLIIHVMRQVCEETSSVDIDKTSAELACRLADYFLQMDKRVFNLISKKPADELQQQLFDILPDCFTTAEAIETGTSIGMSESTVKRFIKNGIGIYLNKQKHGEYTKK